MSFRHLRRLGQVATVASAILILYLTLTPSPPGPGPLPPILGHFLMFVFLGCAIALWYATSEAARRAPRRALAGVLVLVCLFAAATEAGQQLVAMREPDGYDWLANVAGGITGLLLGSSFARATVERERSRESEQRQPR